MTIFKETYVLKFYIQLCDKQVVQLKTAWIWWSTPKTRTVFPLHKTCFEKLNLLSSLSILQAIQSFFCPDYTNVVTLFMHEQQKKLDLSLSTDC